MKNIIRVLFGFPVIMSIPLPVKEPQAEQQGECCTSCGYSYCPSLYTCVRPWETYCKEFDFPYNALYKGSGIILPEKNQRYPTEK